MTGTVSIGQVPVELARVEHRLMQMEVQLETLREHLTSVIAAFYPGDPKDDEANQRFWDPLYLEAERYEPRLDGVATAVANGA